MADQTSGQHPKTEQNNRRTPLTFITPHTDMENLEFHDLQKLNQSIQQLYTLHNLETFGVDALLIIDRLVPSDIPLFHLTNVQTQTVQDTFLPDYPGLSPAMANIKSQCLHEHPITQNMGQALQGACKISDFITPQEFHQKEGLYQEFMRPLETEDQMMLFLPSHNSGDWAQLASAKALLVGFAFNRSQRSFTERDRLLLNLLRPHLFQAYCNSQQYNQLQLALHHLGLIILDTTGKIQLITPQATIWLETYFDDPISPFPITSGHGLNIKSANKPPSPIPRRHVYRCKFPNQINN
jgi:hypothetical protein